MVELPCIERYEYIQGGSILMITYLLSAKYVYETEGLYASTMITN